MLNTKKRAFGFGALIQKTRDYSIKKLNIINISSYGFLWDWQVGAGKTLNPFSNIWQTVTDIWLDKYSWHGGNWMQVDNPHGITKDTKINFLSKCVNTYTQVISPLLFNFYWSHYGKGSHFEDSTTRFKWRNLTYYRDYGYWDIPNTHHHTWKDKKFLFSKKWKEYDHEYEIGDSHGCWEEKVSKDKYETSLNKYWRRREEFDNAKN